jgi:hypothetical protein
MILSVSLRGRQRGHEPNRLQPQITTDSPGFTASSRCGIPSEDVGAIILSASSGNILAMLHRTA